MSPNIHRRGGPEARHRPSPTIPHSPRNASTIRADTDTNETHDEKVARCHQETTQFTKAIFSWLQWDSESDFTQFRNLPNEIKNQLIHISQALEGTLDDDAMETEDDIPNSKTEQPTRPPVKQHPAQSELELSLARSIEQLIIENLDLKAQLNSPPRPQPTSCKDEDPTPFKRQYLVIFVYVCFTLLLTSYCRIYAITAYLSV